MLVNCFFALVSALQGVQLSQLHQQSCWATAWLVHSRGCSCLSCTNKTVGYCSVGALQGGAVVPTAPTELWGF